MGVFWGFLAQNRPNMGVSKMSFQKASAPFLNIRVSQCPQLTVDSMLTQLPDPILKYHFSQSHPLMLNVVAGGRCRRRTPEPGKGLGCNPKRRMGKGLTAQGENLQGLERWGATQGLQSNSRPWLAHPVDLESAACPKRDAHQMKFLEHKGDDDARKEDEHHEYHLHYQLSWRSE